MADARPEFDLAELTPDEHFFLVVMRGLKPDGDMAAINDMRAMMLGMSEADRRARVRRGAEALLARGYLRYARDARGEIEHDAHGAPIYETVGVIISRMKSARSRALH